MKNSLSYSDIALVPKMSQLESRSLADTCIDFAGKKWKLPVIPANMSSTISFELAEQLEENGYFYILHRFYKYKDVQAWIVEMNYEKKFISISLGISADDCKFLDWLEKEILHVRSYGSDLLVNCITIDIAHGHSELVARMIARIKQVSPHTFIIAGNVATPEAVYYLQNAGADAIKVGIGPGRSCTTYKETGFGTIGMFSTLQECSRISKVPLIADGGIHYNGDIAKALVAGASMIMAGGIFAELSDSPAETIYEEWEENTNPDRNYTLPGGGTTLMYFPPNIVKRKKAIKKVYFGSSSEHQKGHYKHVEGTRLELPYNEMCYLDKMERIRQSLASAISYAGGKDLSCFNYVKYKEIN